ncbi:DUF4446 family protein [Mobilitalea sibirica]|uniref:DUF4446 family protein n=1 Tax=Mobilitalea sibirica TaxID=1462919 RepID=A0A8J7HED8_9FIRM|nr:DUF4446 family protein [Mobilitalea sibirica]MBH1941959.1 DUF4446 family protein [Mobilitalea sibirica]
MNISELVGSNTEYLILGLILASTVLLLLIIILFIKQRKLNKKYKKFMSGKEAQNLEGLILSRFSEIDKLKLDTKGIHAQVEKINDNLLSTYQKIGVVKYDAFKEMGGKLSFVLALLDKNNNGIIMNSVHSSREGCYTYLKEIIKGESFLELSEDEKSALNQALMKNNYME